MMNQYLLKNLEIDALHKTDLNRRINALKDLSPSDAVVNVNIERVDSEYKMMIQVHDHMREITTAMKSDDLDALVHHCFDRIHEGIREWKRFRFRQTESGANH